MCGIVGIIARKGGVDPAVLERATLSLAHRGPDDSGTVILHDNVPEPVEIGLGNRRLAVLDLSPLGHQPMHDPDTGNWIIFNGEIYNFREIRERLQREGAQFRSHSDTEVLLKAYRRWGDACVEQLRGMFAFAIWDAQRHRLFAARDPMGIKPLYYFQTETHLLFASEVRTLLGTGMVPRKLDSASLINYLEFGSVYDPLTVVEGISNLGPGQSFVWERGRIRVETYWDLTGKLSNSENRASSQEEIHAALDDAVSMQMVSDVPVGVFLSGGVDSTAIVANLSRRGAKLETFSIVFRESDYSEAQYSRLVAKEFATNHHEITVSQFDALEAIPHALSAMDLPTIDGLNTYLVSRQTRAAGIKVALSGLGGDEVFAGYSSFITVPRMESFHRQWRRLPAFLRKSAATVYSLFAPANDQNRKMAELVGDGPTFLHPYFLSRMLFTKEQRSELLVSKASQLDERADASLKRSLERTRGFDAVNRVSYLESRCYMLNTLLRDADVMSMAHGLELRVPLIDHRLTQMVLSLPGHWKLDTNTPKPLLVSSLAGAMPKDVVTRRKRGFTLPFEHWLKDEMRTKIDKSLGEIGGGPLAGVIDCAAVQQVWQDFLDGHTSWSRPWALYVIDSWCRLNGVEAQV
jgi:asparagine synthase (glutamine-hydrolysing)